MTRHTSALLAAAATTAAARAALRTTGSARWNRVNHRGEVVSLVEGPAVAAGLLAGAVVGVRDPRSRAALALATGAGAAFGLVDDLAEDPSGQAKGLRGHLRALARGQVTTGGLKVLGIGAAALAAAAIAPSRPAALRGSSGPGPGRAADVLASGALIALSANLVNLLDLRPGRALKAVVLGAAPLAATSGPGGGAAAGALGAAAAALPADLDEREMLGDTGANAAGALLGTAVVLAAPAPVRWAALTAAAGLTLASERRSFTAEIERRPVLRAIDRWGRR